MEGVEFDRRDSEYGTFGVQVSRADTATKWRNPHAVFVHPHVELNLTKRLINEFKKASGQIPKGGPGIVHLQVPYRKVEQLLAVVDEAYNCIFRKLRSDTRRVNAVVISGTVMENRGLSPIVHNHFVVPNIKASSQLPFGFAVPGTHDMGIELPTVEGTIEFRFLIPEEWTEGIPRNLFFLLLVTD